MKCFVDRFTYEKGILVFAPYCFNEKDMNYENTKVYLNKNIVSEQTKRSVFIPVFYENIKNCLASF